MDYFSLKKVTVQSIFSLTLFVVSVVWADNRCLGKPLQLPISFSLPYQIKGYLLMDAYSGQVIAASEDGKTCLAPASLTKMMTIYLVAQALRTEQCKLTDKVIISQKAGTMEGSRMFIAPNSRVLVKDLIQGVIVQSGNDASIALAEHLSGSEKEFVHLMNQQAQQLNMLDTHFKNASGLPQVNHYTTPLDMAKLARAILLDFPEYYVWYSQKSFVYSNIHQINRNHLLWLDPSVDGIKTGETKQAGYCLVASAKREGRRLIAVVMGAPSKAERTEIAQMLLNHGFHFFETKQYAKTGETITHAKVRGGKRYRVRIGVASDFWVTVPRGCAHLMHQKIVLKEPLIAPLTEKEIVGELQIFLQDKYIGKTPLISMQSISKGSWLQRKWGRFYSFLLRNGY